MPETQKIRTPKIRKRAIISKTTNSNTPNIEDIKQRAYYIWEGNGYPKNTELDNWLEAEQQLCN